MTADGTLPLILDERDGFARLTLNQPEARNPLSDAMIAALTENFESLARRKDIRAIVIDAKGPVFSAGHDLKEMTARRSDPDRGRAYFDDLIGRCARLMLMILQQPQPVVAAIEGLATAAGCQLVASCDLAVAGTAARFQTPGVHIGLFCSTPMVALSRNLARKHAMEMLLLGDAVSADDALRFGLVNRVVSAGSALQEAETFARRIASKSPLTLAIGKRAFYEQADMRLEEAYRHASRVMVENMLARDAEEGINAFIEKREAQWSGQ